jgi:hypothetical protein
MYAHLIARLLYPSHRPQLQLHLQATPRGLSHLLVAGLTVDLWSLKMSSVAGDEPLAPPASGFFGANHLSPSVSLTVVILLAPA